jgi:methionine-S-sulfoxide reductase
MKATFAAGCFWEAQRTFSIQVGVGDTIVGYTGGQIAQPSYEVVCAGGTGHVEAVQMDYDPEVISYPGLLEVFRTIIKERTTLEQKVQYQDIIYFHTELQRQAARLFQHEHDEEAASVAIKPVEEFYPAEEEHQHYLKKRRWL